MDGVVFSTLAVLAMWTAAGLSALNAARTARTPQGAIGWVVFLLAAPMVALPAYMIFGHHRFRRYRSARRGARQVVQRMRHYTTQRAEDPDSLPVLTGPFEAVAGLPACKGNGFELLVNGEAAFDSIFQAIDDAQEYVLVQFYIVRDDGLGRRLQQHLISAAQRGVAVWFMTDAVGSHGLPSSYLEKLAQAGVNLLEPASGRGPRLRLHINFRNHRKTVITDGRTGFTGGLNVGDEYLGLDPNFGPWRDTHVRLTGPVVQQLQLSFAEDWHWLTDEPLLDLLNWDAETSPENRAALIAATGPGDNTENAAMMFFSAFTAATSRIWVASPYFVPDLDVVAALKHAALRGVDVRILVPDTIDHYLPWLAAFAYFDDLRAAGVRILVYTGGFMHQKVFVVDETIAAAGTANLDNRSLRLNFETMALFFDAGAARCIAQMLEADFSRAVELSKSLEEQKWIIRLGAPVARLLAPVL
ncbi:cardiolipin synthase [Roseobacteraceae bacterium NS-SX3]